MSERGQLEQAIAALETQRAILGDVVVDAALSSMRQQLAELELAEREPAPALEGERKLVTIMFADISGFTALAETMDPEAVRDLINACFDHLVPVIEKYEGTVDKFVGDAIVALFGAPVAHENDPERALRTALEMKGELAAFNASRHTDLGLHFGINTGLVIAGGIGSEGRQEYSVMGDAVNVASRLEEVSERGEILVGPDTYRLTAPLFEFEALEPIQAKGKAEPVPIYRVLAPKAVSGKVRGIVGLESPLVGRKSEFRALQEAVERLRVGVGGIVTIVGEAGIGKSRLVAELREQTLAKVSEPSQGWPSVQWVEGHCVSYGTSIAYLLWLDALRSVLGMSVEDPPVAVRDTLRQWVQALCPDHLDDVYPYLGRLMSLPLEEEYQATLQNLEGEALKMGSFRAVETLLECAANDRPLIIVCEDLHWADPSSMELLEQLLALTDRVSLLVLCVFRPQTKHGSWRLREVATRLYRHRHTDLWLDPLSAAESEALVGNLLLSSPVVSVLSPALSAGYPPVEGEAKGTGKAGKEPVEGPRPEPVEGLPQKLKRRILGHAEGNPFYVEEIIRSLIDTGAIVCDEATGRWGATRDVADIPIPDTLHGVLMARIDRLPEGAKRVLQMAAVIGRIFLYRVLVTIAQEERELDGHLLTLQREGMIRERARVPELEYIFKHELTRDAAYNSLLKKERRVYHRQVAEALERLFLEPVEEQVGLLARHWLLAAEGKKAIPYLLKAGDQARALYAHAEAEWFYQQAVRILREQGQDALAARTLMKLGLVYTAAFEPEKAREAYDEAFTLWEPLRESADLLELRAPSAILRLAVAEPLTLDPGMIGDDVSTFITAQLFEGLVEVDPDYNVLPAAAARWEVADGGTRYVFHLREGLRWNDGTPLTAADFEYAWKRNLALATRSPVAHLLYVIENARAFGEGEINDPEKVGVSALDDLTLEVRLEEPTAYLPHLLAHTVAYPLPQWAVEGHGEPWTDAENLVSNGAYQLVEWQRGERLVLGRNPFYHGRFPGNAERVECLVFTEFGPVLEAYAADTTDAVSMINADAGTIARAREAHGLEVVFIPQPSTYHLVFRADRPPFDDVRVRRAFVHAVDREALATEAWQGQYLPGTGGFVPPAMPGHSAGMGLVYDPERARALLVQAGYPGAQGFPRVTLLYSGGSPAEPPAVPFLRNAWRKNLGLSLDAQSVEWEAFIERRDRDPAHLALWGWSADYPDPDNMLRVLFHSTEGFNTPHWHSARFDGLVEEAVRVADQTRRMELYQEADRILVAEEAVIMPLGYARGRILVKPWVTIPRVPPALMHLKDIVLQREKR